MGLRRSLHLPDFRNPVGVVISVRIIPKVARCSQPWAGGRNPVGIVCGGGAIEGSILRADSIDGAACDEVAGISNCPFHEVGRNPKGVVASSPELRGTS